MSNTLNKNQIIKLLPHREPMLLIDELINIKKLHSATAIMNVKKDAFYVDGHFPDNPVMPGVLIVEAFGQAAAALTAHGIDKEEYNNKSLSISKGPLFVKKRFFIDKKLLSKILSIAYQELLLIIFYQLLWQTIWHRPFFYLQQMLHLCTSKLFHVIL